MEEGMECARFISFLASKGRKLEEHAVKTELSQPVGFHNRDDVAKVSWMVNAYLDLATHFYFNY